MRRLKASPYQEAGPVLSYLGCSFGVNQPYSMDPAAPFGGVKASGVGRELGREGFDEYLDIKAISVAG